uniref:Uncharacterized protein n=1 Tax=Magallana gigas TaxID=29159 RepID=K1QBR7_MAGGI
MAMCAEVLIQFLAVHRHGNICPSLSHAMQVKLISSPVPRDSLFYVPVLET